jgi:hypothetical protein
LADILVVNEIEGAALAGLEPGGPLSLVGSQYRNCEMNMGGPGGPRPPGGGVTGAAPPLKGVVEARRAGTRGETGDRRSLPLLSTPHIFFTDCLLVPVTYVAASLRYPFTAPAATPLVICLRKVR